MARRELLLCTGKHCRKALARDGRLQKAVARLSVDVTAVGCQKVCRGPVLGIAIDDEWQWFERMGSRKALKALAGLVEGDPLCSRLDERRSRKRAGKRRA